MSKVTRREYLGGVAAAAIARWEDEDYSLENVEEWDPIDGGIYTTGEFSPGYLRTSGDGVYSSWGVEDDDLQDRSLVVFYDRDGVNVTMEGEGDNVYGGALTELDTEEAKEFAAAVFQAAEELEQRRQVDNANS